MTGSPLRLGVSSACFRETLPRDIYEVVWRGAEMTPEIAERMRAVAGDLGRMIRDSRIAAIEYLITEHMVGWGVEHPLLELARTHGNGCEPWSLHAPFRGVDYGALDEPTRLRSLESGKRSAEMADALGAGMLVIHGGPDLPDVHPRSARVEASARSLAELADFCAPFGIDVAIELLPRGGIGNTLQELLAILEMARRPNTGVCLDVNHTFPAENLPGIVRALGSKMTTIHISDHDGKERHWLPFRGIIDWPGLLAVLREVNYTGPFLYEVPLECGGLEEAVRIFEENYDRMMGG